MYNETLGRECICKGWLKIACFFASCYYQPVDKWFWSTEKNVSNVLIAAIDQLKVLNIQLKILGQSIRHLIFCSEIPHFVWKDSIYVALSWKSTKYTL